MPCVKGMQAKHPLNRQMKENQGKSLSSIIQQRKDILNDPSGRKH